MSADAIPGAFNFVQRQQADLFDSRMKIDRFLDQLEDRDLPKEVCILEFDRVFIDEELRNRFRTLLEANQDWLSQRGFTIQFVVDSLDTVGRAEVELDEDYYPLGNLFDGNIREQQRGTWAYVKI